MSESTLTVSQDHFKWRGDLREIVTLDTVSEVRPIEGADAIELAIIRAWGVVVRKGTFKAGDRCVYFEVDSALPLQDSRFEFLAPRGSKEIDGKPYHVLRTIKLRGVYSQGLALPASDFPEIETGHGPLSSRIGVTKYEPPVQAQFAGEVAGPFPVHIIHKTDSERVQNLVKAWPYLKQVRWDVTEKLDGTSVTYFRLAEDEGHPLRVCSRNLELKDGPTVYWDMARELDLALRLPVDVIVQGEIIGEGIQGNPLQIKGRRLYVFNVFQRKPGFREILPRCLWPCGFSGAPVLEYDATLPDTVDELIARYDGMKSAINPNRKAEGVVYHADYPIVELGYRSTFKVISNSYLLGQSQ